MPRTPTEIAKIRRSCAIADQVLRSAIRDLRFGISEHELEIKIRRHAKTLGAEKMAFRSIIAFGKNSAEPHHRPTERKLKKGDIIKIDLGVVIGGYCSDITRTFFTAEPTKLQREVYEAVLKAQLLGIKKTKTGINGKELDAVARESLDKLPPFSKGGWGGFGGFARHFIHGLGHGLGKRVHMAPRVSPKSKAILKENDVITIEPGVYLKGRFGVRIEDTVVVGKSGCEILTKFPKKLTVLRLS